jgi:isoprenylcysteine carboxyl methyltransferase (ICMT) family protein YpbQ
VPLHEAVKYVAAAYIAVFVIVLLYVAIMAVRVRRVERDLGELMRRVSSGDDSADQIER